jgi:hypothetical protein
MEKETNGKMFFIGSQSVPEDYVIPKELLDYLNEKSISKVTIQKDRNRTSHSKFTTDGFFLQTDCGPGKITIDILYNFASYEDYQQYKDASYNSFRANPTHTNFVRQISQHCSTISSILERFLVLNDYHALINSYYEETLFKRQNYTFVDAKLSKDGSYMTITTKEFGEYGSRVWETSGVQSVLDFFEKLSGGSKGFDKAKERIKKSVELDICYLRIFAGRSSTELHIFDSKGTRKVTKGFMLYHGVNFFAELNERYFNNPKFYMVMEENGSIFSFDMQKALTSNAIISANGRHYVSTKNFKVEIPDFTDFSVKFMDSCEDKEWAASELLKLEILG